MADLIRLFRGVTELNYSEGSIELTNDKIVNTGKAKIEGNSVVTGGSAIEFREEDGSTVAFRATVKEIKRPDMWELLLYSNGYELTGVPVETIYAAGSTPEGVVQDIVDNYTTNLTYASTGVSGIVFDDIYIAQGYGLDIVKEMMALTGWGARIDANDNFYFEPKGFIDNGRIFSDDIAVDGGTSVDFMEWNDDDTQIINSVTLIGGFEGRSINDDNSGAGHGTGTVFTLLYKPSGAIKVSVGGVEQPASIVSRVDAESKTITLSSSQTDPIFFYTYNRPVKVYDQDVASMSAHGEIWKQLDAPYILTAADGRKFTSKFLENESITKNQVKVRYAGFDYTLSVNELIRCSNNTRTRSGTLVVQKIIYEAHTGSTVVHLGDKPYDYFDSMRNVQDEIKKLKKKFKNDADTIFSRRVKGTLEISLEGTVTWEQNSPVDSFVPGSPTLSYPRGSLADEPDCSGNSLTGTWSGTNVSSGAQYSTSGKRLSCAVLNGSDHRCVGPSSFQINPNPTVWSFSIWVKFDTFASTQTIVDNLLGSTFFELLYNQSSNALECTYRVGGTTGTLSVGSFSSTYSTGTWYLIVGVFDAAVGGKIYIETTAASTPKTSDSVTGASYSIGTNALVVGREFSGSQYFDGSVDELIIFDIALSTAQIDKIIAKNITGSGGLTSNMKLWWSFDNPKPGDRSSVRTTI